MVLALREGDGSPAELFLVIWYVSMLHFPTLRVAQQLLQVNRQRRDSARCRNCVRSELGFYLYNCTK